MSDKGPSMPSPGKGDAGEPEKVNADEHALAGQGSMDHPEQELMEFLKDAPPGVRAFIMQMRMTSQGRMGHPLFERFASDHIHKFLDYSRDQDQNEYQIAASNRWFNLSYVIIFVSVLCFLIVFLVPSNIGLLSDIMKFLLGFGGGFGAGYGFKSRMDARK